MKKSILIPCVVLLGCAFLPVRAADFPLLPEKSGAVVEMNADQTLAQGPLELPERPEWNSRDQFSFTGWFLLRRLPGKNIEQRRSWEGTLFSRDWIQNCLISPSGVLIAKMLNAEGECVLRSPGAIPVGEWRHLGIVYSLAEGRFRLYLDGEPAAERPIASPVGELTGKSMTLGGIANWNPIDAAVVDLTVWDKALSAAEIAGLAAAPPPAVLRTEPRREPARCRIVPVNPLSPEWLTPFSALPGGGDVAEIALAAAPGEVESLSFAFASDRDSNSLEFDVEDFTGDGGAAIAAGALDLRTVKCHFQAGTAGRDIDTASGERLLVPELLLKDPALLLVDYAAGTQAVRYDFPAGSLYAPVADPAGPFAGQDRWNISLPAAEHPIRDAALLQPFGLQAGLLQQMFADLSVPEDAIPGLYRGGVTLRDGGHVLGRVELTLEVLPFKLAEPATAYDLSRPFVPSVYSVSIYDPSTGGELSPTRRNREQYLAELRLLKQYGIRNPICHQLVNNDLELFRDVLRMRRETGMDNDPLYSCGLPNLGIYTDSSPEALERMRERYARVMQIVEEELGHRNVYFYGLDEARGQALQNQVAIWREVNALGGKVFTSDCSPFREVMNVPGDTLNLALLCHNTDRGLADRRHAAGGLVWCYGNPQGGVEDPEIYRRNCGLKAYFDHFDGYATYALYESFGHPYDDFDHGLRDHNLAYPTADGLIPTIALAGYREAGDDVRYATTLRLAIRDAMAGGDAARRRAAAEAEAFLRAIDPDRDDLDGVRREMIRHLRILVTRNNR